MAAIRGRADREVVERQLGLPVVDGQIFVAGAGERFRIGPGEKRTAVDVQSMAPPRRAIVKW